MPRNLAYFPDATIQLVLYKRDHKDPEAMLVLYQYAGRTASDLCNLAIWHVTIHQPKVNALVHVV